MNTNQNPVASFSEHLEVTDTLYRLGAGIDHNDPGLIASVFSEDAVVDFGPCGRKMGLEFPVLTGGDSIIRFLTANAEVQTTTHMVTNARVHVEGGIARLQALVEANHLPLNDHSRRCQMMNWYEVELLKDGHLWRIHRLVIDNAWFIGDRQVLSGK